MCKGKQVADAGAGGAAAAANDAAKSPDAGKAPGQWLCPECLMVNKKDGHRKKCGGCKALNPKNEDPTVDATPKSAL